MSNEVTGLEKKTIWIVMACKLVPKAKKILKSTWAFKIKRFPDGTICKLKAWFCVRGDLQESGVDYFDTYAPVAQ